MALQEILPELSGKIRQLIEKHRACYEVTPHYVVLEERPVHAAPITRRIQAGFDIDIYGVRTSDESWPSPEYEFACEALKQLAETVLINARDSCSIEVIPYASTVILDTKMHFQRLGMHRITITHSSGLEAFGAAEQHALKEIEEQLTALGIKAGGMRA